MFKGDIIHSQLWNTTGRPNWDCTLVVDEPPDSCWAFWILVAPLFKRPDKWNEKQTVGKVPTGQNVPFHCLFRISVVVKVCQCDRQIFHISLIIKPLKKLYGGPDLNCKVWNLGTSPIKLEISFGVRSKNLSTILRIGTDFQMEEFPHNLPCAAVYSDVYVSDAASRHWRLLQF